MGMIRETIRVRLCRFTRIISQILENSYSSNKMGHHHMVFWKVNIKIYFQKCTCECLYLQCNVDPIENSCREKTATKTSNASNCSRFYLTESNLFNEQNITTGLEHCSDITLDKYTVPCDLFKTSLNEQVKYF